MKLPSYYEFCCPVNVVAGHNALEEIPALLETLDADNPMIITDKGVVAAGLVDILIEAVSGSMGIGAVEDDVPPDSELKVVNHLASVYRKKKCDSIIAIGGGSVLDTAKGVNIVVSENSDDLMKFTGAGALKRKLKPLVAVPTTAGTGSEVTLVAVIADHENNKKMLFTSYFLLPDIAVLDSRMTLTLPDFLTASTGMDAMTHAIEAYTCLGKNPISDATALKAVSMISKHILSVVNNPDDRDGRLALAIASTLAGMAFSNSMVGMVHSLGHSTGAVCHVPHGICMATLLPYALEYNMQKSEPSIAELLYAVAGGRVYSQTRPEERGHKTIECIRSLNKELFHATAGKHIYRLKDAVDSQGRQMVPKNKLSDIAITALGDGSIFYNPEELNYQDCMNVLDAAWEGQPLQLQ